MYFRPASTTHVQHLRREFYFAGSSTRTRFALVLLLICSWGLCFVRFAGEGGNQPWAAIFDYWAAGLLLSLPILLHGCILEARRPSVSLAPDSGLMSVRIPTASYRLTGYRARLILQIVKRQPLLWLPNRATVLQEFELARGLDLDSLPDNGEPLWQGPMPALAKTQSNARVRVTIQLARLGDERVREETFTLRPWLWAG